MGSLSAYLLVYLLGGLTFVPLVILGLFSYVYFTLPVRLDTDASVAIKGDSTGGRVKGAPGDSDAVEHAPDDLVQPGDDLSGLVAGRRAARDESKTRSTPGSDVAAGYFAVCREYTPMGINAKPIERSTPVGYTTITVPSPSVYQTMYRSIFDRKQSAGSLDDKNASQRPKKAGNVFYVVLRHGHLMLFDDEEQIEVRHVISLAHHEVSIYSGPETTPEGELYIKRNAIRLSRNTYDTSPDAIISKPFYLFSENCSAKEDFYFALLRNQTQTFGPEDGDPDSLPKPAQFEVKLIISLVERLHSSEEHVHTRWFNALLGRIFLSVHRTADLESYIRQKLTKKISRVKRPSFLSGIAVRNIDTGDAAPFFTGFRLRELTIGGECIIEADVRYTGSFRIEVATTARIDLGSRFRVRSVDLLLAVVVRRIEGRMLFKIKPPPSNRIWFTFQAMPKMEMTIEPVVSSRQITYTVILRQIENRIKEVLAETIVVPFWDDLPFFPTEHKRWRGGIWENDDAVVISPDSPLDSIPTAAAASPETAHQPPSSAQTGATASSSHDSADSSEAAEPDSRREDKSYSMPNIEVSVPPSNTGLRNRAFGGSLTHYGNTPTQSSSTTSVNVVRASSPTPTSSMQPAPSSRQPSVSEPNASSDSDPEQQDRVQAGDVTATQSLLPIYPPPLPARPPSRLDYSRNERKSDDSARTTGSGAASTPEMGNADESLRQHQAPDLPASPRPTLVRSPTGSSLGRSLFRREKNSGTATDRNAVSIGAAPVSRASVNPSDDGGSTSVKRNTLAAVTNVAVQARQWGWNALHRQKEGQTTRTASGAGGGANPGGGSTSGPYSQPLDRNQPMGRGMPLPPPGTPLPMPDRASLKLLPVAGQRRRPVSASNFAEPQPESTTVPATGPMVSPREDGNALAYRHQKTASLDRTPSARRPVGDPLDGSDEGSASVFVVAAPDDAAPEDSEPTTPTRAKRSSSHPSQPEQSTSADARSEADEEDGPITELPAEDPDGDPGEQGAGESKEDEEAVDAGFATWADEGVEDNAAILSMTV